MTITADICNWDKGRLSPLSALLLSVPSYILANILHKRNIFAYYTLLLEEVVIFRDSSGPEKGLEISGNSKVNICLFFLPTFNGETPQWVLVMIIQWFQIIAMGKSCNLSRHQFLKWKKFNCLTSKLSYIFKINGFITSLIK